MGISSITDFKVIINNRDRYKTTRKLTEDLLERNSKVIILDNGSTYIPLLQWYDSISKDVDIRRHGNVGHMAMFSTGLVNEIKEDWCFITDSDIQLNPSMPKDYQAVMFDYALSLNSNKIALALEIKDLPDHYMFKQQVIRNEGRWWLKQVLPDVYEADTDTTFSLIKKVDQFSSFRIAGNFTSKHIPWYIDLDALEEDEKYYLDNYDGSKLTQYTKQHKIKKQL